MKKFIFFTKTNWCEPPRLRHQLANLLLDAGYKIIFFEKPSIYKKNNFRRLNDKLTFTTSRQLINHKLRLNPFLHFINALYEKFTIRKFTKSINDIDDYIIINFNYDYYFLKDIFSDNKIITIINDDFWCRAILGYEKPLRWVLNKTCLISDCVLTVSQPLKAQLDKLCKSEIFYPWADIPYRFPVLKSDRYILLFWGYINSRINFDYIFNLSDEFNRSKLNFEIHLVGPSNIKGNLMKKLDLHPNISVFPSCDILSIDSSNVLAAFIPYIDGNKADDVTSIPNKAFPLLACGLPLLITGMPHFIKKEFILRLTENVSDDVRVLLSLREKFYNMQDSIKAFVEKNDSKFRLHQFISYC